MLSSKKFSLFLMLWIFIASGFGIFGYLENVKADDADVSVSGTCQELPPGQAIFTAEFRNGKVQLDANDQALVKWTHRTGTWGKFCDKKKHSNSYIVAVAPVAQGTKNCNNVAKKSFKTVFKSTGGSDTEFSAFEDPHVIRGNKISTTDYKLAAGKYCMKITRTSGKMSTESGAVLITFTK